MGRRRMRRINFKRSRRKIVHNGFYRTTTTTTSTTTATVIIIAATTTIMHLPVPLFSIKVLLRMAVRQWVISRMHRLEDLGVVVQCDVTLSRHEQVGDELLVVELGEWEVGIKV